MSDYIEGAIENLKKHQGQLDEDGIMVAVSREALEVTLGYLDQQAEEIQRLTELNDQYVGALGDCRNFAGFGSDQDPMDINGWSALAEPLCVPEFVKSQFDALTDELTKWRKGLNSISYDTKDAEIQRLKSTMVREAAELAVILHHEDITKSLDHHLYKIIQRIKKTALPPKDTGA